MLVDNDWAVRGTALGLLASGMTNKATAAKVGVHYNTITHWLADPDFAAELEELRTTWRQQVIAKLQSQVIPSLETILQLRDQDATETWDDADGVRHVRDATPAAVRLAAATKWLDYAGLGRLGTDSVETTGLTPAEARAKIRALLEAADAADAAADPPVPPAK